MQIIKIEPFDIIGISVRTTNANMQAMKEIGELWGKFTTEQIGSKIPDKLEDNIYCFYTNYDGDHTMPYDAVLGYKVAPGAGIPDGLSMHHCLGGTYTTYIAKGDLRKVVGETWGQIWQTDLDRAYTTDFEVYGDRAQNPPMGEVDIFVGVKG